MKRRSRTRVACAVVSVAVGIILVAACGAGGNQPAAPSNPSVSPTSKATLPGPNNFSPSPIAPLNPTASPGSQVAPRP